MGVVEHTHAPRVAAALVLGINAVAVVVLQVPAAGDPRTRLVRLAGNATVAVSLLAAGAVVRAK